MQPLSNKVTAAVKDALSCTARVIPELLSATVPVMVKFVMAQDGYSEDGCAWVDSKNFFLLL